MILLFRKPLCPPIASSAPGLPEGMAIVEIKNAACMTGAKYIMRFLILQGYSALFPGAGEREHS